MHDQPVTSVSTASAPWKQSIHAARAALHSELPSRYTATEWAEEFHARVRRRLRSPITILDVGAGRTPTIEPGDRPNGTRYVGLDLTAVELELAPPGSYDDTVVSDVTQYHPSLVGQFDLIVCFQVLEHVRSLASVFDNMALYLRPGGHFIAQFSGTFSLFGLANRVIPQWAVQRIVDKILSGHGYVTFPAYYDKCWQSAIEQLLAEWASVEVVPYYAGMGYFSSSPILRAGYLAWEEWTIARDWRNLAPYYIVDAAR
jgi:2-polyprenyl-6-hydroxyphenyl methylase/3-demethylubiquinone-9 3-methyltransferase